MKKFIKNKRWLHAYKRIKGKRYTTFYALSKLKDIDDKPFSILPNYSKDSGTFLTGMQMLGLNISKNENSKT